MPWRRAIEKVLTDAEGPMHYRDIAETIVSDGLRTQRVGATPASTVSSYITTSIKSDGDRSPFVKVGPGQYALKHFVETDRSSVKTRDDGGSVGDPSSEEQYDVITSFGMFWRRDLVDWMSSPRLLGMQQLGAEPVDFRDQVGIYLLYDGREVIYVGRAEARSLGRRLYEHTVDRLSTRWDRFSWFGLLPVSDKGTLGQRPVTYPSEALIPALEAIMIEALEPRQNRKRGDDLAAVEFLQKEDPEVERKRLRAVLEAAMNNV